MKHQENLQIQNSLKGYTTIQYEKLIIENMHEEMKSQ